MKLHRFLFIIGLILLLTNCGTTEKFTVNLPSETKIFTPNKPYTPNSIIGSSGKADVIISSDMYCGYILVQPVGYKEKIPLGIDYTIKKHLGTKAAFAAGLCFASIGLGAAAGGTVAILAGAEGAVDLIIGIGGSAGLIGTFFGMGYLGRLEQVAYDYNFGYEPYQNLEIPQLSFELLNPNSPKKISNGQLENLELSSSRKKASSGKDVVPTIQSSKANPTRSDYAKKIEGTYKGNGKLLLGKSINETYTEIEVIIKRIDKNHVAVSILESGEEYFDAPLTYEIKKGRNGGYSLGIENLPQATIQISDRGKLIFSHKKVYIDNTIYTLEIISDRNN